MPPQLPSHRPEDDQLDDVTLKATPGGMASSLGRHLSEQPGDRIGPYKLLQMIGEGGFGKVWMAEQLQPVARRVALKIIKPGMDTEEVIARFEVERQALAMMDHTHIASVFDAGATEQGRPFFVMELVKGMPITQGCDDAHLGTRERLSLFCDVCAAIQHAHQKGIIHRDIKPSNVLVTLHGDKPVVKVIDFGIAKATQGKLTDKTLFTRFDHLIGTPIYMSPEQAALSGLDVDTRSDIYSLGVLLYELLTSKPPFDAKKMASASFEEMRRIIREVEPPKPSIRLSTATASERTTLAKARQVPPEKVHHLVEPDLDWIVMKAIEKDRSRRYETANGLALDLKRFMANEPVIARPPSPGYRFQKLVRRNQGLFLAGGAVFLSISIGCAVSVKLYFDERAEHRLALEQKELASQQRALAEQARTEAERQRDQAKANADAAWKVAGFLESFVEGVQPDEAKGRDVTLMRNLLDKTTNRIGPGLKDQPEVEARLRHSLSVGYWHLGEYVKAEALARRSLELRKSLPPEKQQGLSPSYGNLQVILRQQERYDEAETLTHEWIDFARKLHGEKSPQHASALFNMGVVKLQRKQPLEAEALFRRVMDMNLSNRDNVQALHSLANAMRGKKSLEEAENYVRLSLAFNKQVEGDETTIYANSLSLLGGILVDREKFDEGETHLRKAFAIHRKRLGDLHFTTAGTAMSLSRVLMHRKAYTEAEECLRLALNAERKRRPQQMDPFVRALIGLGSCLREQSKFAEAADLLQEANDQVAKKPGIALGLLRSCLGTRSGIYNDWEKVDPALAAKADEYRKKLNEFDRQHPEIKLQTKVP